MSSIESLEDDLRFLGNRVSWSRAALRKGEVVELASLQTQVEALCQGIEALPPEHSNKMKTGLLALVEEIDQLKVAINEGLEALKAQIGETASRRRALRAYGQQSK